MNIKELLNLVSASNGIIGYTSSLKPGDVITQDYIDRLNNWYVKRMDEALQVYLERVQGNNQETRA